MKKLPLTGVVGREKVGNLGIYSTLLLSAHSLLVSYPRTLVLLKHIPSCSYE